jgi:hypothetical protein
MHLSLHTLAGIIHELLAQLLEPSIVTANEIQLAIQLCEPESASFANTRGCSGDKYTGITQIQGTIVTGLHDKSMMQSSAVQVSK